MRPLPGGAGPVTLAFVRWGARRATFRGEVRDERRRDRAGDRVPGWGAVEADRAVPRRTGRRGGGRSPRSADLLLRLDGRRRLEDPGRRPVVAQRLRRLLPPGIRGPPAGGPPRPP